MRNLLLLAVLSPLAVIAIASADHGGHAPPQAAFDACANLKAGDTCSVAHGDHTMTGTCETPPDATALACKPDHPPGPPPEAIAACSSAKAGDTCTVTHDSHTLSGTCEVDHDGSTLACRPARRD